MQEVEVAFKIKQTQKESEKLLLSFGYKLFHKAKTHDLYFAKIKLTPEMTEQQLKFNCIRLRFSNNNLSFNNFNLFDKTKNNFNCTKKESKQILKQLKQNGFKKVFDTFKTDYVYKKDNSYHQLQNIKKIGLLDYFYNEDIFSLSPLNQYKTLKQEMLNMGFELEYEDGVDKLRSLLAKKLCFSKNQNGDYNKK